jgi:hypothetical protein
MPCIPKPQSPLHPHSSYIQLHAMAASSNNWYNDTWGKLTGEMFDLITKRLDVSSVIWLAACSKEL